MEWHPPSETKLNQLMQSLTTQLSAIERHEKQLEKLKSNNKHTTCQIRDLLETEYSAMVFAQVRHSLIFCRFLNHYYFFNFCFNCSNLLDPRNLITDLHALNCKNCSQMVNWILVELENHFLFGYWVFRIFLSLAFI